MPFPLCLLLVMVAVREVSSLQDQTVLDVSRNRDQPVRDVDRRLLLSDPQTILDQLETVQRETQTLKSLVTSQQSKIQTLETLVNSQHNQLTNTAHQGAVYTIWGRRTCPLINGTATLYTGITGGKMYDMKGSGVTTLCLPHDPDSFLGSFHFPYGDDKVTYIFGAEYAVNYKSILNNDDVPCAVCHTQTSTSTIMIPAKLTCPRFWKLQYNGFLSAERYDYFASDFICVDINPEYLEGTRAVNADGRLIHPVKARCGSLPCPPYKEQQYVSCVVCSN